MLMERVLRTGAGAEGLAVDAAGHCELRAARVEREMKRVRRVRRQGVHEAVADCC